MSPSSPTLTKARQPRLSPRSAGLLMTPEEFDAVTRYDDRYRYELIRGVLVESPMASEAERGPNGVLEYLLRHYQATHPQGAALNETLIEQEIAALDNRRRADRVIWAGLGHWPDPAADIPAIVVEFVAKAKRDQRRDYEQKREEYLAIGIREYWVIDRFQRILTIFRNAPSLPAEQVVPEGQTYQTDLLPGFELPLARLLEVADRWGKRRGR